MVQIVPDILIYIFTASQIWVWLDNFYAYVNEGLYNYVQCTL